MNSIIEFRVFSSEHVVRIFIKIVANFEKLYVANVRNEQQFSNLHSFIPSQSVGRGLGHPDFVRRGWLLGRGTSS